MLSTPQRPTSLAVLTSGGDAAGMNGAVRAVARSGLAAGLQVYTVSEGLQGLVDGGDEIRRVSSRDVGGILHQGETVLGTARSADFRTKDGRRRATSAFIGLQRGKVQFTALAEFPSLIEPGVHRPRRQSWVALRPVAEVMARSGTAK